MVAVFVFSASFPPEESASLCVVVVSWRGVGRGVGVGERGARRGGGPAKSACLAVCRHTVPRTSATRARLHHACAGRTIPPRALALCYTTPITDPPVKDRNRKTRSAQHFERSPSAVTVEASSTSVKVNGTRPLGHQRRMRRYGLSGGMHRPQHEPGLTGGPPARR